MTFEWVVHACCVWTHFKKYFVLNEKNSIKLNLYSDKQTIRCFVICVSMVVS